MDPLIIIPARTSSRGVADKNFRVLAGMAPVNRAIYCARAIVHAKIVVTTDCLETSVIYTPGGTIHHLRPPALATDDASMVDVVLDVLQAFPGPDRQPVLLVQPTQPLRTPQHLQRALNLLHTYKSLASVVEVEPAEKLYYEGFQSVTGVWTERRQDAKRTYRCDGTVYGFHRGHFVNHGTFTGAWTHMMIIDPAESCPLDTPLDWYLAELRLRDVLYRAVPTSHP